MSISPLAPDHIAELPPVAGVRLSAVSAGIKYPRDDLMLASFSEGTTVAGVLTRSATASAPVEWCRRHLQGGVARALIVNSGNANAFTGRVGEKDCARTGEAVAASLGCAAEHVFIASTGVIGERLPMERILDAIPGLQSGLDPNQWQAAARAIMTTDTFPKTGTVETRVGDRKVRINGFAKGSGMIEPDMATMLAFLVTDANLPAPVLQALLTNGNRDSFNAITVDSDTSTSDTCLLFATGKAKNEAPHSHRDPVLSEFSRDLGRLMRDLAIQVVRDGEGASKLIEITVQAAENNTAARIIAKSIANSPLVKTAMAGEDANWGRIVMAVGKSGEVVNKDRLGIEIGGVQITRNGEVVEGYREERVSRHLAQQEIRIQVDVGVGTGRSTVWTCDLTHDYIRINADYRS